MYPPQQPAPQPAEPKVINTQKPKMEPLAPDNRLSQEQKENLDLIMGVSLEVAVEIGRTRRKIQDIIAFSKGGGGGGGAGAASPPPASIRSISSWLMVPPEEAAGAGAGAGAGAASPPPASIRSISSWLMVPPEEAAGAGSGAGAGVGAAAGGPPVSASAAT